MSKILLVGDPCIDWLVSYEPNQTPKGNTKQIKNLDNNPIANIIKIPGGVLALARFIKCIKDATDVLITYQDLEIDEISKIISVQTTAFIKNCNDKNQTSRHIDQFLGFSDSLHEEKMNRLPLDPDLKDIDMVIIDDADKGLRKTENDWIDQLKKGETNEKIIIIHKINGPFNENKLIQKLGDNFGNQCIAVINADDLREQGLELSKQLSWDKTIEDFFTSFPYHSDLEDLRKYGAIIVRFNLEATLVLFNSPTSSSNETEKFDYYLFYDPNKYEGQTMDETNGNMQGFTIAFVATLCKRFLHPIPVQNIKAKDIERYSFLSAIQPAMAASNSLLKNGYSIIAQTSLFDYPAEQIFSSKTLDQTSEIQFAGISHFLDGPKPISLLKHLTLNSKDLISTIANEYVVTGKSSFLKKIPVFQVGGFKTYDHEEIESFRSFNKLIKEYLMGNASKPLSIAVFGPPGSGKSFGVNQIAGSEKIKEKIKLIEINISQLQSYADLVPVFHETRDINLTGKTPLIFFDEFDTAYNSEDLGWIQYFLAPMQDGVFKDGEKLHPLGKAIFVFAGGTRNSYEEFVEPLKSMDKMFKEAKGPDFISRLKGFINVKGVDQKDRTDNLYPLRRAIVLRSILERDYPILFNSAKVLNIDLTLLNALLEIRNFKFGARSLESIIRMSDLTDERKFKKSNLASSNLMSMHIDIGAFVNQMDAPLGLSADLIESMAIEIHNRWYAKENLKLKPGEVPKATFKEWKESEKDTKDSNRAQAMDYLRKLNALGYTINRQLNPPLHPFTSDEIEILAEMEHNRWNEEKITLGWTYGKVRNDTLKIHDNLLPWHLLPDGIKKYDRDAVGEIPDVLKGLGFEVVKTIIYS